MSTHDSVVFMFTRDPLTSVNAKSIHVFEVFKNLTRLHRSILLVPDVDDSLYSHSNILAVPHVNLGSSFRFLRVISFQVALYLWLRQLVAMLRRHHPQITIIFYVRQSVFFPAPLIFAARYFIPTILEVNGAVELEMRLHSHRNVKPLIVLVHLILRWYYSLVHHVVVVTPQLKRFLMTVHRVPSKKISIIENGTNTQHFKPLKMETARKLVGLPDHWKASHVVGFVGNMEPWQGLETLLRAASVLRHQEQNVKFLLVGDGKLTRNLKEMTRRWHLERFVMFTGKVPYSDVPVYINAFDVVVTPFIRQRNDEIGLSPLKVYDALACGKAVISSRIPNLEFIEQVKCGLLVEPENARALAAAIKSFFEQSKESQAQMGMNGRRYVVEKHDWFTCAQQISILVASLSRS